jgi:uncharacterized protein (TIGR02145 family)
MHVRYLILSTVLLWLWSLDLSAQRLIYVSVEGSNANEGSIIFPYRDLQYAIDRAQNGDTIFVAPGLYRENLLWDSKDIFISSYFHFLNTWDWVEQTILDGGEEGSVIRLFQASGGLQGFTLRHGRSSEGSAIHSILSRDLRIAHCLVTDNRSEMDSPNFCIYLEDESSTLEHCRIRDNQGEGSLVEIAGATTLSHCTLVHNQSLDQSAMVHIRHRGSALKSSIIADNLGTAIQVGTQAFACDLSHLTLFNNSGPALKVFGVGTGGNTEVVLVNSLLWGNAQPSLLLVQPPSVFSTDLYLDHSIVEGGLASVQGNDFTRVITRGNVYDTDPALDPLDYSLSSLSPALGKAVRTFVWEEKVVAMDSSDLQGLARPYPRGSFPDLGALESPLSAASTLCVDAYFNRPFLHLFYAFCGQATDDSGNENHPLINTATLAKDRYGRQDQAYFFSSSILAVGIEQDWMDREFTVSGWVRAEESGTLLNSINLSLLLRPGCGGWCLEVDLNSNFEPGLVADFPLNSWTQVALVKRARELILYLNGQRVAEIQKESDFVLDIEEALLFGGSFRGLWDDIGIWKQAFSDQDVEYLYYSQTVKDCPLSLELNAAVDYRVVEDGEGNLYPTLLLGNQTWMASNLRAERFGNGELLPFSYASQADLSLECARGNLYGWADIQDSRNICPQGWRVPDQEDWTALRDYLRFNGFAFDEQPLSQAIAQSLSSGLGWIGMGLEGTPSWNGGLENNGSGFGALPLGYFDAVQESEVLVGETALFWSRGESPQAFFLGDAQTVDILDMDFSVNDRMPVRCIKGKQPPVCQPPWTASPCTSGIEHKVVVESDPLFEIEGYALEQGDWIGAFYQRPGGTWVPSDFAKMRPGLLTELTLCGQSSQTSKEGFATGESLLFKVWSCAMDSSFAVSFTSFLPENAVAPLLPNARRVFQPGATSWVYRFRGGLDCQEILLQQGVNFISSYIEPLNANLEVLFAERPEVEWLQTEDFEIYLQQDFFEQVWNSGKGYYLGSRGEGFWEICGSYVDSTRIFSLKRDRWNYISFPKKLPQRASSIFRGLSGDIVSVLTLDPITLQEREYFPLLNTRDFVVQPGMGLGIRSATEVDFQFTQGPFASLNKRVGDRAQAGTLTNGARRFPLELRTEKVQRLVVFPPASLLQDWEEGDEMAALDAGGEVMGSVVLKEDRPVGMVVLGEGMELWRGFDHRRKAEYILNVEGVQEDRRPFEQYIFFVEQVFKVERICDEEKERESFEWKLYPNPTKDQVRIDFSGRLTSEFVLEVRNALGVLQERTTLKNTEGPFLFSMDRYPEGLYFIRLEADRQVGYHTVLKKN